MLSTHAGVFKENVEIPWKNWCWLNWCDGLMGGEAVCFWLNSILKVIRISRFAMLILKSSRDLCWLMNVGRLTEGGQLGFCFDLIFASKKDRTGNKKVA